MYTKDIPAFGPLQGVRVVHATQSIAGPYTATRMADFGADVISRIMSAEAGNAQLLAEAVRGQIAETASRFLREFSIPALKKVTVCGNTTMLHLFCGEDVSGIGRYPFTPAFLEEREYRGEALGIPADLIILLPSISSYVGADITAGILAADLPSSELPALLADLGTNGEMALVSGGEILCTSTAAGPALEGACIECGVGGVKGAVNRVLCAGGKLSYSTIGNAPPVGLCGCGLVDFVACLLERGDLDETGYLEEEKISLTPEVWLSQADIRQYQLAKSAVCAGMRALICKAGLREEDVSRLLIAGGLGYYIDAESAARTGLIPSGLKTRTEAVGNGSLYGAYLVLTDDKCRAEAREIAARCETVDLSSDAVFNDEFIQGMMFE